MGPKVSVSVRVLVMVRAVSDNGHPESCYFLRKESRLTTSPAAGGRFFRRSGASAGGRSALGRILLGRRRAAPITGVGPPGLRFAFGALELQAELHAGIEECGQSAGKE